MRRSRAFSMIELLVVIGLIVLLVALLIPVVSGVRKQAATLSCMSNLRQLALAFQNYAVSDRQGRSFRYNINQTLWVPLLQRAGKTRMIQYCPEARDLSYGVGNAATSWGPGGGWMAGESGSYAFNGFLYDQGWTNSVGAQSNYYALPAPRSADVPVFADSIWIDTWPTPFDLPPPSLYFGSTTPAPPYFMERVCIDRHRRAINVAFLDGHAATVPLEQLWSLKWSADWVDPLVPPVIP